jgi:hypothetical protein
MWHILFLCTSGHKEENIMCQLSSVACITGEKLHSQEKSSTLDLLSDNQEIFNLSLSREYRKNI